MSHTCHLIWMTHGVEMEILILAECWEVFYCVVNQAFIGTEEIIGIFCWHAALKLLKLYDIKSSTTSQ